MKEDTALWGWIGGKRENARMDASCGTAEGAANGANSVAGESAQSVRAAEGRP